jgi:toxin-antitoxin system PIN domain toxin
MSIALLDVNVLIALFDPSHPNHEDAHRWFGRNRKRGWATCPVTINGCIRVLSNPAYPTVETTPAEVASRLRVLCAGADHQFWADSVSLLDESLFRPEAIAGHRQITDIYLLGLAVRRNGRLTTFDRSITGKAVVGASPDHLDLIGTTRS